MSSHNIVNSLGVLQVALITYFNVCGGPWGVEEVVAPLGPFIGILSLIIWPIIYCIPLIRVTSNLSTKFPLNGGYSIWVQRAFGDFWGFQESFWSYTSGVTDNALYPGFVYQLSEQFIGVQPPLSRYFIKLVIAWLFSLPTLYHVSGFTKLMWYSAALVLIPFVVFCVAACFQDTEPERLTQIAPITSNGIQDLVMVLYWNYAGFDSASAFSNEINDIGTTMYKGLTWALLATILTYILPVIMGTLVTTNWSVWGSDPGDCSWSCVVTQIGGPYLGYSIVFSSTVGALGLYMAELFEDAWQLCGMAEAQLIPKHFSKRHSKYGSPINSALFSIFLISILVYFDFSDNLLLNNFFGAASTLLEFAAYIHFNGFKFWLIIPILASFYILYTGFSYMSMFGILVGFVIYRKNSFKPSCAKIKCLNNCFKKEQPKEIEIEKMELIS